MARRRLRAGWRALEPAQRRELCLATAMLVTGVALFVATIVLVVLR